MVPRAITLLSLAMLLPLQPASAQGSGRVVILTVDGTTLADWRGSGLPALKRILSEGAVGLLSTRTSCPCANAVAERAASYNTFATVGSRRFGDVLRSAGILATAVGDASGADASDLGAALSIAGRDGTIEVFPGRSVPLTSAPIEASRADPGAPGERRTSFTDLRTQLDAALGWARLVVVDLGDAERADRLLHADPASRQPWVDLALQDADRFIGDMRASLQPNDTLVVGSLAPPLARAREGLRLGAVAATGLGRGLLASETTRRAGLITIADLAATILTRLGVEAPEESGGRPATLTPGDPAAARTLESGLVLARRSRTPAVRAWMWSAAAMIALAFILVVSGRGRRPGVERFPRRARDLAATGLLGCALAPGAMLLSPFLARTATGAGWIAALLSVLGALGARITLGRERAVVVALIATTFLALADTIAGGPLAQHSAIGPEVASGLRVAGTSDAVLAMLTVTPVLAAALLLDGGRNAGRIALGVASLLGLGLVAAAAPTLGGRVAAPIGIVPAAGAFALFAAGRRPNRRALVLLAIVTLFAGGLVAAAHLLRDPPAVSAYGASAWTGVTFTSAWLAGAGAMAFAAGALLTRRRPLAARAFWGRPSRRASLASSAVAAGVLLIASPSGMEAVATITVLAAPVFFLPFLAPD